MTATKMENEQTLNASVGRWQEVMGRAQAAYMAGVSNRTPKDELREAKRAYVIGHITLDIFERRAEAAILAGA